MANRIRIEQKDVNNLVWIKMLCLDDVETVYYILGTEQDAIDASNETDDYIKHFPAIREMVLDINEKGECCE